MKKLILGVLFIVILSIGFWYLQNYLNDLNLATSDKRQVESEAGESATSSQSSIVDNQEDFLRAEAFKIARAPLQPSKDASAEMIALAKEKIKISLGLIEQDYNYDLPWLDLGAYRKLVGDYNGAISAWKFLIKIRPQDFIALHNLGELYGFVLADYAQSEKYFLKSIENNPNNVQAYFSLVDIYAVPSFGKADQIEKILLRGLENNPNDANLEARLNSYQAR